MVRNWVAIPAAGVGARMGGAIPKQYLSLRGKTVIEYTLACFLEHPAIAGVTVALAAEDGHWERLGLRRNDGRLQTTLGGGERCYSVLNALKALSKTAGKDDWVLVHDAARPCLRRSDLDCLIDSARRHPVGGLLALPVRDTLKRAAENGTVDTTIDRRSLWQALTPQMFRLSALRQALEGALSQRCLVTDEAQAMELAGQAPLLVEGHEDNIKITRPQDLELAELFLSTRG